jgi:hypothetical protein
MTIFLAEQRQPWCAELSRADRGRDGRLLSVVPWCFLLPVGKHTVGEVAGGEPSSGSIQPGSMADASSGEAGRHTSQKRRPSTQRDCSRGGTTSTAAASPAEDAVMPASPHPIGISGATRILTQSVPIGRGPEGMRLSARAEQGRAARHQ